MASVALVLAACATPEPTASPAPSDGAFQPTWAEIACPEDVEVVLLVEHGCGRLEVLEDRNQPEGNRISVFVLRMDPPSRNVAADPMLAISGDIGDGAGFGGLTPLPGRVHRTTYVLEPRGVGHSIPNLECPEFEGLAVEAVKVPTGDATFRQKLLASVKACRDHLTASGVEVGAYDAVAAAADVVDLRRALGISHWNLIGFGSQSRILIEAARQDAEAVRSLVLDSPQLPDLPDALVAGHGLDDAIAALDAACAADPACNATAPNLSEQFRTALARLDASPANVTSTDGFLAQLAGASVKITVEGGTLLRAIRSMLGGDGPANIPQLPSTIALAANGDVSDQLLRILGNELTLCAGYRPTCLHSGSFSLGAYLSILCQDDAPFLDLAAVDADPTPAYHTVFGDNPYVAACVPWAVEAADRVVHEPLGGAIPLLVFTGEFDAFVPELLVTRSLSDRPNTYVVTVPTQTHNVLGFTECTLAIRNAWVDNPDAPPADLSCLTNLKTSFPSAD